MNKRYPWLNHLLNFLAVILGVYLAFYMNERAKNADSKKERLLLINSMINDLSDDIKSYENYQIPINVQYRENIDSMLVLVADKDLAALNQLLPNIFQVENYAPTSSTYNSIKSSGQIKLIEDLDLQKSLSDYYDGLVLECNEKNQVQVDYFLGEVVKWLTKNANFLEMKLLQGRNLTEFANTLLIYQSLVNQKVVNYELIVEESQQLKTQLEELVKD